MKNSIPNVHIVTLTFYLTLIRTCIASDISNLFDTCPTDTTTRTTFINGLPCKNPLKITASDFKSSFLNEPGDTENFFLSSMIIATAYEFPGLNTLGLSTARIDLEVDGMVPPHAHPRASEIMFVSSGDVVAGFVDSNNRVFQKGLKKGDVFVFPKGLLHYCFNGGFEVATVFSVLNGQNPGMVSVTGAMFANTNVSRVREMVKSGENLDLDGVPRIDLVLGIWDGKNDQI